MNELVNEWMNEWTNERTNERMNKWMNEWMNDSVPDGILSQEVELYDVLLPVQLVVQFDMFEPAQIDSYTIYI